jgi:hypothetical protein
MACNCNSTGNIYNNCVQCSAGLPCNCPPDYSVTALNVPCECCPPGFYPIGNGYCCANGAVCNVSSPTNTPTIPCNTCEDSVSADCVFLKPNAECFGIKEGTTLTQFIEYMCSDAFVLNLLQSIGLSTTLKAALCQIVSVCPVVGSTTPIPGPIDVTVP